MLALNSPWVNQPTPAPDEGEDVEDDEDTMEAELTIPANETAA
jgi:hypothetical protein